MENISITNILDKLEDKLKLARIEKRLVEFRKDTIIGWLDRMDRKVFANRQEYSDKTDKEIEICAKEIMEVVNNDSKG